MRWAPFAIMACAAGATLLSCQLVSFGPNDEFKCESDGGCPHGGFCNASNVCVTDAGATDAAVAGDGGSDAGTDAGCVGSCTQCGCPYPNSCGGGGTPGMCGHGSVCTGAWCWENPRPQGNSLMAVHEIASNDVWAVGAQGTAIHYDGTEWTGFPTPTTSTLTGVWGAPSTDGGAGSNDVWATGPASLLLHYDGSRWSVFDAGLTAGHDLNAISGYGPGDFWIVGNSNEVLHHAPDGTWQEPTLAVGNLTAVWADAPSEAWAVSGASAVHLFGDAGSAIDNLIVLPNGPGAVWGSSPTDVWLIPGFPFTFHYDGTNWTQLADGFSDAGCCEEVVRGGWISDAGDVWATALVPFNTAYTGTFYHWIPHQADDGGAGWAWIPATLGVAGGYEGLSGASSDAWAVGDNGGMSHLVLSPDGGASFQVAPSGNEASLRGIVGVSAVNVWAVGGTTPLGGIYADVRQRSTSGIWSDENVAVNSPLSAITTFGPNDYWAVGFGAFVAHYDGSGWQDHNNIPGLTQTTLYAIGGPEDDAGTLFTAGDRGELGDWLGGNNVANWGMNQSPASDTFFTIANTPVGYVALGGGIEASFATPAMPTFLLFDGGTFYGSAPSIDGGWPWVVGAAGMVGFLVIDGGFVGVELTPLPAGATPDLRAIWASPTGEAWTVGNGGALFYWNGSSWSAVTSGTDQDLYGIWGVHGAAGDDVWITGASGTILRSGP